jgi:dihydroorotate dehydrogenase (NAD+) catalytic subunit
MKTDLKVKLGKLVLKNPVMVASGTFGYAQEFEDFMDLKKLGAVVTKTITIKPRQGNLPPRTCETPAGMLNSIGLENPGVDVFIKEKIPYLASLGIPVIVSIASEENPDEFIFLAKKLDKIKCVYGLELNISCPNMKKQSLISQDAGSTFKVVSAARKATKKTLITKLSPNVTNITEIALAAENAGSDALSLINTLVGISIDIQTRKLRLGAGLGGLSGPAIRPVALNMVRETYKKVKIPIIGMGGIMDAESAIEFFIAGASAISIGTANFIDPGISVDILSGIERYLKEQNIPKISYLTGSLR